MQPKGASEHNTRRARVAISPANNSFVSSAAVARTHSGFGPNGRTRRRSGGHYLSIVRRLLLPLRRHLRCVLAGSRTEPRGDDVSEQPRCLLSLSRYLHSLSGRRTAHACLDPGNGVVAEECGPPLPPAPVMDPATNLLVPPLTLSLWFEVLPHSLLARSRSS